ncbi:hypothetical protein KH5_21470 [Urechidicola sp. KH5]
MSNKRTLKLITFKSSFKKTLFSLILKRLLIELKPIARTISDNINCFLNPNNQYSINNMFNTITTGTARLNTETDGYDLGEI